MKTIEWDETKDELNKEKHGVSFDEASTVLFGPTLQIRDLSSDEERFKAIGFSKKLNVLVVVYCYRNEDTIRIISARKATKKERNAYEKTL